MPKTSNFDVWYGSSGLRLYADWRNSFTPLDIFIQRVAKAAYRAGKAVSKGQLSIARQKGWDDCFKTHKLSD